MEKEATSKERERERALDSTTKNIDVSDEQKINQRPKYHSIGQSFLNEGRAPTDRRFYGLQTFFPISFGIKVIFRFYKNIISFHIEKHRNIHK